MNFKMFATTVIASAALTSTALASTTGTLLLEGQVVDNTSIVVTPNSANHRNLQILTGETGRLVGTALEKSNNLNGYLIFLKSQTGGKLVHTVDAAKSTNYKVSYDGGAAAQIGTSNQQVKSVTSLAALTSYTSEIKVNVDAYPTAPSGYYQDTLTVTIQAR